MIVIVYEAIDDWH